MPSLKALGLVAAVSAVLGTPAHSLPILVEFEVNMTSKYDYAAGTLVPITPIVGVGSLKFDNVVTSVADYGDTTITIFGGTMGTTWSSPITGTFPADPYSGAYGPFNNSYTFPNVSDYASTFLEEAASQANTFISDGQVFRAYHIELRATKRSAPRIGNGTSDYAFTPNRLLEFYQSFVASGEPALFSESYEVFDLVANRHLEGSSLQGYVTIKSVTAIPEPDTLLLMLIALSGYAATLRRSWLNQIGFSGGA